MKAHIPTEEILKQQCNVSTRVYTPLAHASALVGIYLSHPNLDKAISFFYDFGLNVIYADSNIVLLRGNNDQTASVIIKRGKSKYLGHAFKIDSIEELKALSKEYHVPIQENIKEIGGKFIELRDPDGFIVRAMYDYDVLPNLNLTLYPQVNHPGKNNRINETIRIDPTTPPTIYKIGHTVIGVRKINTSLNWYQYNFGLIVSDFQLLPNDPLPTVAFMRFNRGNTPTDHHSIAIASVVETGHLHTAFELADMEAVITANKILHKKKYHHTWGIGRHLLGSQIFDYWRDPEGFMFEHYADSDQFDESKKTGYHLMQKGSLHQWGPKVSADMSGKIPTLSLLKTLASRLSNKDDLSLKRLINLVKAAD